MEKKKPEELSEKLDDEELKELCERTYEELLKIGIPVRMPEEVKYMDKRRSALGLCYNDVYVDYENRKMTVRKTDKIEISKKLKCDDKMRRSVMAHELIHTALGHGGHNGEFYEYCKEAERVYHYGLFDRTDYLKHASEWPYKFQCFKCGRYLFSADNSWRKKCDYCQEFMMLVKKIDYSFLDMKKSKWRKMKKEEKIKLREEIYERMKKEFGI